MQGENVDELKEENIQLTKTDIAMASLFQYKLICYILTYSS